MEDSWLFSPFSLVHGNKDEVRGSNMAGRHRSLSSCSPVGWLSLFTEAREGGRNHRPGGSLGRFWHYFPLLYVLWLGVFGSVVLFTLDIPPPLFYQGL